MGFFQLIAKWLQFPQAKFIVLQSDTIGWLANHITVYCAWLSVQYNKIKNNSLQINDVFWAANYKLGLYGAIASLTNGAPGLFIFPNKLYSVWIKCLWIVFVYTNLF